LSKGHRKTKIIFGRAIPKNLCDAVETRPERFSRRSRERVSETQGFRARQENFSMVCSLVKKGLLGAALGAGALYLAFGTSATSYVKTAFCRVRQSAKAAVDPRFEIERARQEIASLKPAFEQNKEELARAEVAAEDLEKDIVVVQASLEQKKAQITKMAAQFKAGDFRLTGHVVGTADELKSRLANRLDEYKATEGVLKKKQELLKSKRQMIESAHNQLENLRAQKASLETQLSDIEAQLSVMEAAQTQSQFNFDNSALSRAKDAVAGLQERLNVMRHLADINDKYGDIDGHSAAQCVDSQRDVLKEVDEAFGPTSAPKSGDRSL
jgi:predicted  nucleic acid-binding Zn-ribbon protein